MAQPRKRTTKIYEIKAHNANVTCLDLGETGRVLVTGGQDRNVNLWAIGQTECFMSLTGHNRPIDCVRFAYNDDFVYSADDIGIIRRWDLNAQTICSTLNGHMKSVRTLDFNPSGEYVVSGSNDTTVRLWDVRSQNQCLKTYRRHISHVNSVKFSPDGLWIASAGTEGSIIIWDLRKSKEIMEFAEQPPMDAVTCIQFHPYEFLLAVGRIDGTVCIYDLESRMCISKTDATSHFYGHAIQCVTFSETGECLFVGTRIGISVIGWEPDRGFDHIPSTWTNMADMKVVNKKLICGSYENDFVSVNALNIHLVSPFYNPSAFNQHSTTRKSFSRGNQKLRLSITGPKPSRLVEENEDNKGSSLDGQSSPNLSIELVDESANGVQLPPPLGMHTFNGYNNTGNGTINSNTIHFDSTYNNPIPKSPTNVYNYTNYSTSTGYSSLGGSALSAASYDGPSSLKMPGERDLYQMDRLANPYNDENEFNLNDSNPPIITNYDHTEMVEDFPVNQNLQPNGAPNTQYSTSTSLSNHAVTKTAKPKATSHIQKRTTQISISSGRSTSSSFQQRGKLSQVSSASTTDLHKLDDNMVLKKSASSNFVANRGKRPIQDSQSQLNKENARNKNIPVQFITKPPTRSRTSLELRTSPHHQQSPTGQRQSYRISSHNMDTNATNIPVSYRPDPALLTNSQSMNQRSFNGRNMLDDSSEIQMLSTSHEQVYHELSNRHATLQLIRNSTRSHDIVGALKQAIKLSGRTVFVDLLGAILEKTSSWNLDLCLLLLPEIYELLQSHHKFHYTRACDTLRVILSNFLPIIQENIDPWAASGLGVDVTREERQRKCIECHRWLLKIRSIPESNHCGTTLTQLQNMISV